MADLCKKLCFCFLSFLFFQTTNCHCPCVPTSLCDPITTGDRDEVFIFQLQREEWKHYDWSKVTTVAMFGEYIPELMCYAHSQGARVVLTGFLETSMLTNSTATKLWLDDNLTKAKNQSMDGINIDFEGVIFKGSLEEKLLTELVQNTTTAFHKAIPGSQVTFDVAWSPACIDQRCYDYKGLADACDFLFVMAYDEQSQIYGPCIAMANSPYLKTIQGVRAYLNLTIEAKKLVLGVPWYGYDYRCLQLSQDNTCTIKRKPFRGANCSDAAGSQKDYSTITQLLANNSTSGRLWNSTYAAPFFNYKDQTGYMHQVWYDDPLSLAFRYGYATFLNLRGVGVWHGDTLDYSDDPTAKQLTKAMWDAI